MIQSFKCRRTQGLWEEETTRDFPGIGRVAMRKLFQLHAAEQLSDLRVPPGNHLEALSGKRAGQYSIRLNQQWRICFVWTDAGPAAVEIVDYHK